MAVFYCLVSVPLQVAFFHEYQIVHPGTIEAWSIADAIIDVFFIVDIFVNYRTGARPPTAPNDRATCRRGLPRLRVLPCVTSPRRAAAVGTGFISRGIFVRDARLICQRYTTTGAPIDIISSLPISLILSPFLPFETCGLATPANYSVVAATAAAGYFIAAVTGNGTDCDVASTNPLARCFVACGNDDAMTIFGRTNRILRLVRLIKLIRAARLGYYVQVLFDWLDFNPGLFRLIMCFVAMLLACHWIGCCWYYILEGELRDKPAKATIEATPVRPQGVSPRPPLPARRSRHGSIPTRAGARARGALLPAH